MEVVHLFPPLIEDQVPDVAEQLRDAFGQNGVDGARAASTLAAP